MHKMYPQPYNFERLLYYLSGEDNTLVAKWMSKMEDTTKLDLDELWHNKLKQDFMSARITDDEMCATMRKVYDELKYCIDPHTAVAVAAAGKLGYDLYDDHYGGSAYAMPVGKQIAACPAFLLTSLAVVFSGFPSSPWKPLVLIAMQLVVVALVWPQAFFES